MGHSSIQVTVDIYGHLIPGANISFVDKLDSLTYPQESARQPQEIVQREFEDFEQVLGNVWLGRRDSNPDTQIQSPSEGEANKENQQLDSANLEQVWQNPQRGRNRTGPKD